MNRRPLVWFAACWVGGSAAAASLGARGALLVLTAGVLLAFAAVAGRQATLRVALACLLALGLAAGQRLWADARNVTELVALQAAAEADGPRAAYAAEALGHIISAVEVDGDRVRFRMEAHAIHAQGQPPLTGISERLMVQLRLSAQQEQAIAAAWRRGDRISVAGELSLPVTATNSGGFDYRRYLGSQRIHWLLKGAGAAAVPHAPAASPVLDAAALLGRVDAVRAWLGARFDQLYPAEQAGYMKGLVLGIRDDLDPEQFEQFARLGLTHILAISGLHVGVFLYVLGGLLRLARLPRERVLLVLMLAVPLYVLITGASPSVFRAGIMAVLGLAAARMGKLKDGLHLIGAAAIAMLMLDPYYLNNVSFQLSFIVTMGLIVGVPPLRRAMPRWKRCGWLLDLLAVTVVAQAVSFPVTVYYFNQVHALSLLANLALVPFIGSVVMPLGLASLLVSLAWEDGGQAIAYLIAHANDWSLRMVEWMASSGRLRIIWKTPPLWWVAAWLALMLALFRLVAHWDERRRALAAFNQAGAEAVMLAATADWEAASTSDVDSKAQAAQRPVSDSVFALEGEHSRTAAYIPETRQSSRYRIMFGGVGLLLFALLLYGYAPDYFDRTAVVRFFDVGQGDSALVRTAEGKHILIDGGGAMSFIKPGEEWRVRRDPFEVGRKVLVPLLMRMGVRQIDLLIITHLDYDHIRGLSAVAANIPIKEVWWNGTLRDDKEARALMNTLSADKIALYAPKAGDAKRLDSETELHVLWPAAGEHDGVIAVSDQNERSVVTLLKLYGAAFLLTGDIGVATEREIVRMIREADFLPIPIDVMKVAHHGSRHSTSSEWLSYWAPFGAVISAGASNPYGHPHPDTLGRLEAAGVQVWRIDQDGEAAFRIDQKGISFAYK